ncbi:unnamed protein product [Paramecium octaurelia]|uniref:Transmembrane protein n=1 Tax=Paramecium octaurelia TaxID=43137 RepID=A0A8S1XRL6_PAROT|nr:unnamed protein product [Paramecium octaurelia]
MFSIVEASSKDKRVKAQPSLHITNNKQQTFGQEQQIQKEYQIDFGIQGLKQQKQLKTLRNLDLIRKENGFDIYQFPLIYKQQIGCIEEYKTIILIGTQNSQKLNFIKFIYGYRFEIDHNIDISKDKQNDEYEQMKVYYIRPSNGQLGLRIIYTLDYNDDLIYEDQQIFKQNIQCNIQFNLTQSKYTNWFCYSIISVNRNIFYVGIQLNISYNQLKRNTLSIYYQFFSIIVFLAFLLNLKNKEEMVSINLRFCSINYIYGL